MPRLEGTVAGGVNQYLVHSPVRKQRLKKTKKELEDEAAEVLKQAVKIQCVVYTNRGVPQEKYYTVPNRRKNKIDYGPSDKKASIRSTLELENLQKKTPRTFTITNASETYRPSVFDIFKKTEIRKSKKTNLRRSVSDATNLKSKISVPKDKDKSCCVSRSDAEDSRISGRNHTKKQLSPIIESDQREDYFTKDGEDNKENQNFNEVNIEIKPPTREKCKDTKHNNKNVTEFLKKYINEIDEELFKETGIKVQHTEHKISEPEIIIIDLDRAEQISRHKKSKTASFGKKLKSLTNRKIVVPKNEAKKKVSEKFKLVAAPSGSPTANIKKTMKKLEEGAPGYSTMIHSSQKPADKPPLTKGQTVDTVVKKLSSDYSTSPPPKTNILVTPNISIQHNHNQPFSYTRGISPENYNGNDPGIPVIYAQVVCANGATGPSKQTVHTVYTTNVRKHPQHSDSDEGLGYEEHFNRKYSPLDSSLSKKYDNRYVSDLDRDEYVMEADEPPVSPKMRATYFNGHSYGKMFSDVERGRADGMDSKCRGSLSESVENDRKINEYLANVKKSDWSARRDLLESRINQRLNDKRTKVSPLSNSNMYIVEPISKHCRNGSANPVGFSEKYEEVRTDRFGERFRSESRNKKYFGDRKDDVEYITNEQYIYEHKSIESQVSDCRSSPESRPFDTSHNRFNDRYGAKIERQQRLKKEKGIYQSNPEIYQLVQESRFEDSYHDSLRRQKQVYKSDKYVDHNDRKDKFGDSGIENDIKRDSVDILIPESRRIYGLRNPESEDEGFASSLLIASERQHTEEAASNSKNIREYYDDNAPFEKEEYDYRKRRPEFVPRGRSIDDGCHSEIEHMGKKIEKKPPKSEKKSGLEKVKQLFMSSSKKKKEKQVMVKVEDLSSRYKEYQGNDELLPHLERKRIRKQNASYDYRNRSRLPTPSPEPQKNSYDNGHIITDSNTSHNSWFKSLDRLSRKKNRKDGKNGIFISADEDLTPKSPPTKNLRFFGDSLRERNISRPQTDMSRREGVKSLSTRDLHNISEESRSSRQDNELRNNNHKSMLNMTESEREMKKSIRSSLKPPASPNHRFRDPSRRDDRGRISKNENSSLESSTEGDSSQQSQQSQRSIVYLHAATVGDIPGPGYLRNSSRAASREELTSNSSKTQPRVKTLSRSFSMLAPWKPMNYRESMNIDYSQYPKPLSGPKNGKYEQKISKKETSKNVSSSTLKKKAHETRRSNQNASTLSRSKEKISHTLKRSTEEPSRSFTSTLYKKKDSLPRENLRYSRENDKRISAKSVSVESLGANSRSSRKNREDTREISRSVSMPRNPEKSAGWFKMKKRSYANLTSQRL